MLKSGPIPVKNKCLYFIALIGLTFIATGSAFIVQLYRLFNYYSAETVSLLTGGLYYLLQAGGIGIAALLFKKSPAFAGGRKLPFIASLITLACALAAVFSSSANIINFCGLLMNFAIGILSGCYLTRLVTDIPWQRRGIVFGCAYAIGSIGTWLLSLPGGGKFLHSYTSIIPISLLMLVSILLLGFLNPPQKPSREEKYRAACPAKGLIYLAAAVLFLLSLLNTLGFSFPLQSAAGSVYIEFTRAFYAGGLIIAGIISDKNRRWGAICCMAALAFPFAALALGSSYAGETLTWVLAYFFLGFFAVYRILVFADISAKTGFLSLAALGLLGGRLGDAAGALGAAFLPFTPLIIFCGLIFILVIILFFYLYQRLYISAPNPLEAERRRLEIYAARFKLSQREREILNLIARGLSNSEIAAALYITESTVKFHTGNIFKKTGRGNRTELSADFQLGEY